MGYRPGRRSHKLLVNCSFHPHVWFVNSGDIITHNIVMAPYEPVNITDWGKMVDNNIFTDMNALETARSQYGTDESSIFLPLVFSNPHEGDYTLSAPHSESAKNLFENFDMNGFGVVSPRLRTIAKKPVFSIPIVGSADNKVSGNIVWNGLRVKNIETAGEQSATGMDSVRSVYVIAVVDRYSILSNYLRPNDVILEIDGIPVNSISDLPESIPSGKEHNLTIFRNQTRMTITIR